MATPSTPKEGKAPSKYMTKKYGKQLAREKVAAQQAAAAAAAAAIANGENPKTKKSTKVKIPKLQKDSDGNPVTIKITKKGRPAKRKLQELAEQSGNDASSTSPKPEKTKKFKKLKNKDKISESDFDESSSPGGVKRKQKKIKPSIIKVPKEVKVDVEKQCGVPLPTGGLCARSLTCKTHSMGAKRAVQGRSQPYDVLLAAYQKRNQVKLASLSTQQQLELDNEALMDDTPLNDEEEFEQVMAGVVRAYPVPLERKVVMPTKLRAGFFRLRETLIGSITTVPPLSAMPSTTTNSNNSDAQNSVNAVMASTGAVLGRTIVFDTVSKAQYARPPRVYINPTTSTQQQQQQQQPQPQQPQPQQPQQQSQQQQQQLQQKQALLMRQRQLTAIQQQQQDQSIQTSSSHQPPTPLASSPLNTTISASSPLLPQHPTPSQSPQLSSIPNPISMKTMNLSMQNQPNTANSQTSLLMQQALLRQQSHAQATASQGGIS